MKVYALYQGWVHAEIDGIQINGKNYSASQILTLEADNAAKDARIKELEDKRIEDRFTVVDEMEKREALEAKLAAAEKRAELAEMSSSALMTKLKRTQHISRNRLLRLRNLRHKIIFALKDVEDYFNRNCYETARIKIRELIRWEIKF